MAAITSSGTMMLPVWVGGSGAAVGPGAVGSDEGRAVGVGVGSVVRVGVGFVLGEGGRVAVSSSTGVAVDRGVAAGDSTVMAVADGASVEVGVSGDLLGVVTSAQAISPTVSRVTRNMRMEPCRMCRFYQTSSGRL